jgi:hypothetical protein
MSTTPAVPLRLEFEIEVPGTPEQVWAALATAAHWEHEFVDELRTNWVPLFDQLRLYLPHFPGQRATTSSVAESTQVLAYLFPANGDIDGKLVDEQRRMWPASSTHSPRRRCIRDRAGDRGRGPRQGLR